MCGVVLCGAVPSRVNMDADKRVSESTKQARIRALTLTWHRLIPQDEYNEFN